MLTYNFKQTSTDDLIYDIESLKLELTDDITSSDLAVGQYIEQTTSTEAFNCKEAIAKTVDFIIEKVGKIIQAIVAWCKKMYEIISTFFTNVGKRLMSQKNDKLNEKAKIIENILTSSTESETISEYSKHIKSAVDEYIENFKGYNYVDLKVISSVDKSSELVDMLNDSIKLVNVKSVVDRITSDEQLEKEQDNYFKSEKEKLGVDDDPSSKSTVMLICKASNSIDKWYVWKMYTKDDESVTTKIGRLMRNEILVNKDEVVCPTLQTTRDFITMLQLINADEYIRFTSRMYKSASKIKDTCKELSLLEKYTRKFTINANTKKCIRFFDSKQAEMLSLIAEVLAESVRVEDRYSKGCIDLCNEIAKIQQFVNVVVPEVAIAA